MSGRKCREADAVRLLADIYVRILTEHFTDIANPDKIEVTVGRRSRLRLGAVRRGPNGPAITINPLLLLDGVPEDVAQATIAHELCHVVHGYGTHERPKQPPHRGGRVAAELRSRGLDELTARADAWIRANWSGWYERHADDLVVGRASRQEGRSRMWRAFLEQPGIRSAQDLYRWSEALALRLYVEPIGGVEWLQAGTRQRRLSYCRTRDRVVLLHGVLAQSAAPESVLRLELASWLEYWSQRSAHAHDFSLDRAISEAEIAEAQRWRRYNWNRFRKKHAPV